MLLLQLQLPASSHTSERMGFNKYENRKHKYINVTRWSEVNGGVVQSLIKINTFTQ